MPLSFLIIQLTLINTSDLPTLISYSKSLLPTKSQTTPQPQLCHRTSLLSNGPRLLRRPESVSFPRFLILWILARKQLANYLQLLSTRRFPSRNPVRMRFSSTSSTLVSATLICTPLTVIGHWQPSSHLLVDTKVPVSSLPAGPSSMILKLVTMLV